MNFEESRKMFLGWLKAKGYAARTIYVREHCVDEFIRFAKENNIDTVREVTRQLVDAYCVYATKLNHPKKPQKLAFGAIRQRFESIRIFFNFLYRQKILFTDPAAHVESHGRYSRLPRHVPTEQEMENILARADLSTLCGLRDRAIMEVLYSTGIRRKELVDLDIYDVDTREGVLRVRQGKGGKDRTVPLGKTACEFVERYLKEVRPRSLCKKREDNLLDNNRERALFLSNRNKRIVHNGLDGILRDYVHAVKPEAPNTCHAFRHAFATHMLKGGADLAAIQRILGHAHIKTTEIYTQVQPEDLKEALLKSHPHGRLKA